MEDKLPEPRTVDGHTVGARRVRDDGKLSFYVDRLACTEETFSNIFDAVEEVDISGITARVDDVLFNVGLTDGSLSLSDAERIHEAMEELQEEYDNMNSVDYTGYKNMAVRRVRSDADVEIVSEGGDEKTLLFNEDALHPDDYHTQENRGQYDSDKDYYWFFTDIVDVDECDEEDFVTGDWL